MIIYLLMIAVWNIVAFNMLGISTKSPIIWIVFVIITISHLSGLSRGRKDREKKQEYDIYGLPKVNCSTPMPKCKPTRTHVCSIYDFETHSKRLGRPPPFRVIYEGGICFKHKWILHEHTSTYDYYQCKRCGKLKTVQLYYGGYSPIKHGFPKP